MLKKKKISNVEFSWSIRKYFTKAWNTLAIFAPRFSSLNKFMLVEESQSQSADYSWQIPQKIT